MQTQASLPSRICFWALVVFSGLAAASIVSQAQKVVVQNAGGGRKQELVYDASGRVVETRSFSPDGTLDSHDTVEYKQGFFVPDLTNIGYWPGGKQVKTSSHVTFDQNANFTGELIETYDQAGKHVGGHRLVHNPETGVFRCWDWDGGAQAYKLIHCPASPESGSEPEEFEAVTPVQAAHYIATARGKAAAERKSHSVPLGKPTIAPGTFHDLNVGIVLPAHVVPGERVSGTIVQDLEPYQDVPDLMLIPMTIPVESSAQATPLRGWEVLIADAKPQPADSPFSFTVPRNMTQLKVSLRQQGNPAPLSRVVPVPTTSAEIPPSTNFKSPIVLVKGGVAEVNGPFSANPTHIFASMDAEPAPVVALTPRVAFFHISDQTNPGQHHLILSVGPALVAIPVVVADVIYLPQPESVTEGQSRLFISRVVGLDDLPDKYWRTGIFPRSSVQQARKLAPGYGPPSEASSQSPESDRALEKEAEEHNGKDSAESAGGERKVDSEHDDEAEETHTGSVLLVIKNGSPENVSLRGSGGHNFVLTLTPHSFEQGDFVYKFVADPLRSGTFALKAFIIPFLAPSVSAPFRQR